MLFLINFLTKSSHIFFSSPFSLLFWQKHQFRCHRFHISFQSSRGPKRKDTHLLPSGTEIPSSIFSQLGDFVVKMVARSHFRDGDIQLSYQLLHLLMAEVEFSVAPDRNSKQAALFSLVIKTLQHFLRVLRSHEDHITNYSIEFLTFLNFFLGIGCL